MNKLTAELVRLYCLTTRSAEEQATNLNRSDPQDKAQAMVLGFARTTDWPLIAKLYQAIQEELDLPAPAVSVSGKHGYQLWFSLAEPVSVGDAHRFLAALRNKYLAEIPPVRLSQHPCIQKPDSLPACELELPPALDPATQKWSAFVDPSMGALFVDEPWLETPPNPDKQAGLLAQLKSIKIIDFLRVLNVLQGDDAHTEEAKDLPVNETERSSSIRSHPPSKLVMDDTFSNPRSFLLAVMNDHSANMEHRIEAAKALLPYFDKVS